MKPLHQRGNRQRGQRHRRRRLSASARQERILQALLGVYEYRPGVAQHPRPGHGAPASAPVSPHGAGAEDHGEDHGAL